jgi:hypothetical protein
MFRRKMRVNGAQKNVNQLAVGSWQLGQREPVTVNSRTRMSVQEQNSKMAVHDAQTSVSE